MSRELAADRSVLRRYGFLLSVLAIWQISATQGWINASIFPPLDRIALAVWQGIAGGALLDDIAISLRRSGLPYGAAVLIDIPLGLFMGQIRRVEQALDPILQFFRQTSALALYPVFILLPGLGEASKVFVIFRVTLFPILLATISGVKEVDRKLIEMAAPLLSATPPSLATSCCPPPYPDFCRAAPLGDDRAAAADRRRVDRRQQGPRFSGDERPVKFTDPADVRRDLPAGRAWAGCQCRPCHPATPHRSLGRRAALIASSHHRRNQSHEHHLSRACADLGPRALLAPRLRRCHHSPSDQPRRHIGP
ncbi:hypothetical protein [uncultured Paracoccus sp.]|uniref:ABC transporter permease n=1 Tax=uncultured Paracoccus sp. TaxID=189685 RepID=UPI0026260236|nr:hypothetical protein [uncultured Paracoccus sp.]